MNARLVAFALFLVCLPAAAQRKPVALEQGTTVGRAVFPPGDTARGGRGQPVDGIEGSSTEMVKQHYHAHLSLFDHGEQVAVPYGIGIVRPFRLDQGFVVGGEAYYWLHTHDATGIIHIESPEKRVFTLGDFFDVWGEPLEPNDAAGMKGRVRAFVDGKPWRGRLRAIPLRPHGQITLEVGRPEVAPPLYVFPSGL